VTDAPLARYIIRKRAEHLGTVEAANAQEALKIAAKEFDIPPELQNRIVVENARQHARAGHRSLS
jgi:hypothetical protein